MKTGRIFYTTISLILFSILAFQSGCKKEDNGSPSEKEKYAWATGNVDSTGYGVLLFTPDAGVTWIRQANELDGINGVNLIDVWAIDKNNVWVTGEKNTILKTIDGGNNWTKVQAPAAFPEATLSSIYIDNKTNIWIGGITGNTGIIYKSTDGGNNFILIDNSTFNKNGIQGIWVTASDKVFVAGPHSQSKGLTGFIAVSNDEGINWDSIVLENNYNIWEWIGVVSSGNNVVVYGGKGRYSFSTDDGKNWENDSIPVGGVDGADINHMIMLDDQTWWAACDNGNVWITRNEGNTWIEQTNLPPNASGSFMVGLDSWDYDHAIMVGSGFFNPPISPILTTVNGGDSWVTVYECSVPLWKVSVIRD